MIEWLERLEDLDIARRALPEVREAGGDRERAGWLRWDDVREELESRGCDARLGRTRNRGAPRR